jgi:hypothetical protein
LFCFRRLFLYLCPKENWFSAERKFAWN